MENLDTAPMPLDSLAAAHGGLDEFRIDSSAEVSALLKRLIDGNLLINLNGSDGAVYTTTLWSIDTARGSLSFSVEADDARVQALVEAEEAIVVAYLDSIKVQFDAQGLVLVRGGQHSVLTCALPRVMYRFQRRNSFRVKPTLRASPVARFCHPMIPDMSLAPRVLHITLRP